MSGTLRIIFMGTPDFALPSLEKLLSAGYEIAAVVTQPDRPKGRKKLLTPPPVKTFAQEHGLPVMQPEKLRAREAIDQVLALHPDLIVTAAYGQILPKQILDAPPLGCVNVHASLLPKYRGGAPIHRAIINGESRTGVTIMYMDEQMDTGDILAQKEVPIKPEDTAGSMHRKLSLLGAELLAETIPRLEKGLVVPRPQNHQEATYAPNLTREDEVLDWSRPANEVYNHIRGLHPWPVASTTLEGQNWKIWWAEPLERNSPAEPGQVLEVSAEGILVACGTGAVRLTEIQPAGKRRMYVAEYLRGASLPPGKRFGE